MTNKVSTKAEKWEYPLDGGYRVVGEIVYDTGRKMTLVKNTLYDNKGEFVGTLGEFVGESFTVTYGAGMAAMKAMKEMDISKNIRMADSTKQLAFDL